MTMLKLCSCNKPIPIQDKTCGICASSRSESNRLYDKYVRDKQSTRLYNSEEWRALANLVRMEQYGLCQICLSNNKMVTGYYDTNGNWKRNIVDHKIPIKVDWSKRLKKDNCWVLCQSCHNKKTAEDRIKYR